MRTTVIVFQGFWYFVIIDGLSIMCALSCVIGSLFCTASLGGVYLALVLTTLLISMCGVVCMTVVIFCLCTYFCFYTNNSYIPFRLPLV